MTLKPSLSSLSIDYMHNMQTIFDETGNKSIDGFAFLRLLTDAGIRLDDARIASDIESIKNDQSAILSVNEVNALAHSNILIQRALSGQLVVRDFPLVNGMLDDLYNQTLTQVKDLPADAAGSVCERYRKYSGTSQDISAAAFCSVDGQRWSAGAAQTPLSIQEICAPMNYLNALEIHGAEYVHTYVGLENSGGSSRQIVLDSKGRPHNPFMMSGMIMTSHLISNTEAMADRFDYTRSRWEQATGSSMPIGFGNSTYLSQRNHSHISYCLGHLMMERGVFPPSPKKHDIESILDFYFMNCSIEVTCEALSLFAATLAYGGMCPITNEHCFDVDHVKNCLSMMSNCGLNDYSGTAQFRIDFPMKSSESGIIMLVVPNLGGICAYAPKINQFDISVFGMQFVTKVCQRFGLSRTWALRDITSYRAIFNRASITEDSANEKDFTDYSEENSQTQLFYACYKGNSDYIRKLYARGVDLNEPDYDLRTPLHVATCENHKECVRVLLMLGASPFPVDQFNNTPLDDARRYNFSEIVKILEAIPQEVQSARSDMDAAMNDPNAFFVGEDEEDSSSRRDSFSLAGSPMESYLASRFPQKSENDILRDRRLQRYMVSLSPITPSGEKRAPTIKDLIRVITKEGIKISLDKLGAQYKETSLLDIPFLTVLERVYPVMDKVLEGRLCVGDFPSFCKNVEDIYRCSKENRDGHIATYIPQLARVDPDKFGVSVCSVDAQQYSIGDSREHFCVQSCSKPLTYAIAQELVGEEQVHEYVGYEPSGRNFNELLLSSDGKPHNPCVNSGAIMTASLVMPKEAPETRFDYVTSVWTRLAGGRAPGYSNATFLSELSTADRNFCLGYMMKEKKCFPDHIDSSDALLDVLRFYFQLCSLTQTCESMAVIAATLANGGVCPVTGERVFQLQTVRNCLNIMSSSGMYDFSGEFEFSIGVPCKSGVAGALLIVIPGVMGICTWSPKLDDHGNSLRGIEFCKELETKFAIHKYSVLAALSRKKHLNFHTLFSHANAKTHALLMAAVCGDLKSMLQLLAEGVGVNDFDYDRRTALHVAVNGGRIKTVKLLLSLGASLDIVDRWGNTPLDVAKQFHHTEAEAVIMKHLEAKAKSSGK